MKRKTKFILFCLAFLGALFCVGVGVVWYAVASVFDSTPHQLTVRTLPEAQREAAVEKIRQVRDDVLNASPGEEKTVTFDKDEVDALLSLVVAKLNREVNENLPAGAKGHNVVDVMFEDGAFTVFFSKYLGESSMFGDYVNLKARLRPIMENGRVSMAVDAIEAGDIGLPASVARTHLDGLLGSNSKRDKMADRLLGIVTDVSSTDDSLSVSYYPAKIRELVGDRLNDSNLKRYLKSGGSPR